MDTTGFITVKDACGILDCQRTWIHRLVAAKRIGTLAIDEKTYLVREADVLRYADERRPVGRPRKEKG